MFFSSQIQQINWLRWCHCFNGEYKANQCSRVDVICLSRRSVFQIITEICSFSPQRVENTSSSPVTYLRSVWRSAQQSFTSACFFVTPAARPGCSLGSWDTLTSSIYRTQACRLGGDGFWSSMQDGKNSVLTMIWPAMSRISLSPKVSRSLDADMLLRCWENMLVIIIYLLVELWFF